MKKLFYVLIIVLCPVLVQAATVTGLAWNPVTTYTDGSTIAGGVTYHVYCGTVSGAYTIVTSTTATTETIGTAIASTKPDGTYYCAVTAADVFLLESAYSNEVSMLKIGTSFFVGTGQKPSPPGNLKLQ